MHRVLIISLVLAIVVIPSSIGYLEYGHLKTQTTVKNLNESVREVITGEFSGAMRWAEYNNVSLNSSSIVNTIMNRFYVLQNYTSFQSYYKNYSKNFTESAVFVFNKTQFNASDPQGLDLDYFYFQFLDIYTKNSEINGIVQPTQLGTITYSIDVGTGQISGPNLTWQVDAID